MAELLQIFGALLILAPFGCQQLGSLAPDSRAYLWPNLFGSVLLAVLALSGSQWGFLLLEVSWALVTAHGLIATARRA